MTATVAHEKASKKTKMLKRDQQSGESAEASKLTMSDQRGHHVTFTPGTCM